MGLIQQICPLIKLQKDVFVQLQVTVVKTLLLKIKNISNKLQMMLEHFSNTFNLQKNNLNLRVIIIFQIYKVHRFKNGEDYLIISQFWEDALGSIL
jgi:hypothetical protein